MINMAKKQEISWITGVKGCCCISVVLLHLLACLFPAAQNGAVKYLPITGMYNYIQLTPLNIFFNGSFAVYIFWTLSAFLITRSYYNHPNAKMLARKNVSKFFRISSSVIIVSCIAFLLLKCGLYFHLQAGGLIENSFWINERDYSNFEINGLISELIWKDWIGSSKMIPPLWTLRFEFAGSILVTTLLATGQGKNKKLLLFLSVLLLGGGSLSAYICFVSGMILADIYEKENEKHWGIVFFGIGIIMGAYPPTGIPVDGMYHYIYKYIISNYNTLTNSESGPIVWYVISSFLVLFGIMKSKQLIKMVSNRLFHFLGSISFYIYICHIPVIWTIGAFSYYKLYTNNNDIFLSAFICTVTSIVVTILCACLLKKINDVFLENKISKVTLGLIKNDAEPKIINE
jgi:peptidoglycan/LPS O-acetylase OafA/YrhL